MTKTAIVTGSSRGIGKDIAIKLAEKGFNIVINSRKHFDSQKVAQEIIEQYNVNAIGIEADVRVPYMVTELMRQTIKEFKRIDVLVNNAGVAVLKPLAKTTDDEWNFVVDTNLKGVFLCSREVLPYMISQKSGCIVNISSGAGKSGFSELSAYCASKFGVIGLTESLAEEVSVYGIQVIAVCPGAVATEMQRQFMSMEEFEKRKHFMIHPNEVADVVVAAIDGKYKTGSSIDI